MEGAPDDPPPVYVREDGAPGRVDRGADILHVGRAPRWDTPLVVQVSRWDRLKDHLGVMRGFARLGPINGTRLVLAGPAVTGVADDPEGPAVLGELTRAWRALPHETRHHVQIVSLPVVDVQENAAMVNALQRHATIVVQKSLEEGFGLTVTEAMWKGRPVVASAVGGIVDQIDDGRDGLLLHDPPDPGELAARAARAARRPRAGGRARRRGARAGAVAHADHPPAHRGRAAARGPWDKPRDGLRGTHGCPAGPGVGRWTSGSPTGRPEPSSRMEVPVRVGDIMSGRPIVVGERSGDVRRLMEVGHVRHLPVVEEGRLVGVWIATGDGPLVMLAPDRVHQIDATADAAEALDALIGGAEAVWSGRTADRPGC